MSQKTPELSTENNRKPLPFGVCSGMKNDGSGAALTACPDPDQNEPVKEARIMAKHPLPTPDELRQLLTYDEESGLLTWLPRDQSMFNSRSLLKSWNSRHAGKPALNCDRDSYRVGAIFGRKFYAHRVAWAIFHGEWPEHFIDHINGDPSDNRIKNLRDVRPGENSRNAKQSSRNSTGTTGVYKTKRKKPWQANIRANGKLLFLGRFPTKQEAIEARKQAELEHGYHQNHGRNSQ